MDELVKVGLTAAAGKVFEKTLEVGADFLKRINGPKADALGKNWADKKGERVLATAAEASQMLMDLPLQAPPDRVLAPILTGASNEDAGELRSRWAALLANSAVKPDDVLPAFPGILRELSPTDVKVLDWMFERSSHRDVVIGAQVTVSVEQILGAHGLTLHQIALVVANLSRHKLIADIPAAGDPRSLGEPRFQHTNLTPFGIAFVAACRPPIGNGHSAHETAWQANSESPTAGEIPNRPRLAETASHESARASAEKKEGAKEWGRLIKRFEKLETKAIAASERLRDTSAIVRAQRPNDPAAPWEIRSSDPECKKDAVALCVRAGSLIPDNRRQPADRWLDFLQTIGEGRAPENRVLVSGISDGVPFSISYEAIDDLAPASVRGCLHQQAEPPRPANTSTETLSPADFSISLVPNGAGGSPGLFIQVSNRTPVIVDGAKLVLTDIRRWDDHFLRFVPTRETYLGGTSFVELELGIGNLYPNTPENVSLIALETGRLSIQGRRDASMAHQRVTSQGRWRISCRLEQLGGRLVTESNLCFSWDGRTVPVPEACRREARGGD